MHRISGAVCGEIGIENTSETRANIQILLTAEQAFPALERLFLNARSEISAGFRVFDPATKLRSAEARSVGDTWGDLVADTVGRGVQFQLQLADFDPVVAPSLHRNSWRCAEQLRDFATHSGAPQNLAVTTKLHGSKMGVGLRLLLWPKIYLQIKKETDRLNAMPRADAERDLHFMPYFMRYLRGTHPNFTPSLGRIPQITPATHHQKFAVVDRETLYIGGLDLDERRYDTPEHKQPGAQTWHDLQVIVQGGPAVAAHHHLQNAQAKIETPDAGTAEFVRTLSRKRRGNVFRMAPKTVDAGILKAHEKWISATKDLIYLETQYFRSRPLARVLAKAAVDNPNLQLLLVLPAAPDDLAFEGARGGDVRYGEYLQAASVQTVSQAFGARCFVMSPAQPRPSGEGGRATLEGAPLVYLHSKVSVFDTQAALVSSANLNGRSLRWDTEAGVVLRDPEVVQSLRDQCFSHWLPNGAGPEAYDPKTAVTTWRKIAVSNAETAPDERQGFIMPYRVQPAKRFGRNLPGVPEELV